MYDLIIIGAGPAGLTAALYALRANKKVLILESKNYGGQIINASKIENYPGVPNISGFEYATILYKQVMEFKPDFKIESVVRITKEKTAITTKGEYKSKAIIIATGAENRKLGLMEEEEYIGKGVSYCATCDGNFYKDKIVAVVGGGNTALTDTIYLSDIASRVYLIHRKDTFKAEERYLTELKGKSNVEIILNSNVTRINGNEMLENIEVEDNNKNRTTLEIKGLFIAVGQEPKNEIFSNIIELDKFGYIKSNDGVHTNIEGIYVAGDTRVKELRQLVTATSDGAIAASVAISEIK